VRWGIGVLLDAGVLINYFDRINLSVGAPQLQLEFGLTDGDLGWLFSGFSWSYALLQIPTGMIFDRFRRHVGLSGHRLPLVARLDRDRVRRRSPAFARRAGAGCRGRARIPRECQGDWLLVSARRAGDGDLDLRCRST
jgi:MFS family permease